MLEQCGVCPGPHVGRDFPVMEGARVCPGLSKTGHCISLEFVTLFSGPNPGGWLLPCSYAVWGSVSGYLSYAEKAG